MATGKELDELIQYENWDDNVDNNKWDLKHHETDANDDEDDCVTEHINDCVALHIEHTHKYIHWERASRARIVSHSSCTLHPYSHWLKFEPCPHSTHDHPHVIPCVRSLHLDLRSLLLCLPPVLVPPSLSSSSASSSRSSTRRSWKTCATPPTTGWGHLRRPLPRQKHAWQQEEEQKGDISTATDDSGTIVLSPSSSRTFRKQSH